MKKRQISRPLVLIIAVLTALVLLTPLKGARQSEAAEPLTAEDIIDQMAEKAEQIEDLKGVMISDPGRRGEPIKSTYEFKRPYYFRIETTYPDREAARKWIVLLNDEGCWNWNLVSDEVSRRSIRGVFPFYFSSSALAMFSLVPEKITEDATELHLLGQEKINGKDAYLLQMVLRGRDYPAIAGVYTTKLKFWIDTLNLSLFKMETYIGEEVRTVTVAKEFQEIAADFWLPVKCEETSLPRGFVTTSTLMNMEVNKGIPDERFVFKLSENILIRDREPLSVQEYEERLKSDPDNVNLLYNLGLTYLYSERNYEKATRELEKVVELMPDSKAGYAALGRAYGQARKYEEAAGLYRKAIDRFPDYVHFRSRLAQVYQQQGRPDLAIEEYRKVIDIEPTDYGSKITLARLLSNQEKFEEAGSLYRDVLRSDTWSGDWRKKQAHIGLIALYQKQNRLEDLLKEYLALVKASPEDIYTAKALGDIYLKLGKKEEAVATYRKTISQEPEDNEIRLIIARTLRGEKAYEEAEKVYLEIVETAGEKWPAEEARNEQAQLYLEKARRYEQEENYEKAIESYIKAIELKPEWPHLYAQLASLCHRLERKEEALKVAEMLLEKAPENANAYSAVAQIYRNLKMYDEAIEYYQKAVELAAQGKARYWGMMRLAPGELKFQYQFELAEVYKEAGKNKEAIKEYEEIITQSKTEWFVNRAQDELSRLYRDTGGLEEILREHEKKLTETERESLSLYKSLGEAYRKKEQYDKAIEMYQKALKIASDDLTLRFTLADLYKRSGMVEEAVAEYEKLVQMAPGSKEAKRAQTEVEKLRAR